MEKEDDKYRPGSHAAKLDSLVGKLRAGSITLAEYERMRAEILGEAIVYFSDGDLGTTIRIGGQTAAWLEEPRIKGAAERVLRQRKK